MGTLGRRAGWILTVGVLSAAAWLSAQQPTAPPAGVPSETLRVSTRLVLVEAVVTDKSGQPVTGLTSGDFTVLEDGKPQKVATFSLEKPAQWAQGRRPPTLPPDVYTNRAEYQVSPGALTVILLDSLNTETRNQVYARLEMLKYLDTQLQPGERIAVVTLGRQLRVMQDFTDDPVLLREAVEKIVPQGSMQLSKEDIEKRLPPSSAGAEGPRGTIVGGTGQVMGHIRDFLEQQISIDLDSRVQITAVAFKLLGNLMAGYPGRKNLVWVTGGFPTARLSKVIKYGQEDYGWKGQMQTEQSYENDLRKAAAGLSDAGVAVYPVDARGLLGDVLTASAADNPFGTAVSSETAVQQNAQAGMNLLANETGGRVFINRNDIDHSVALALDDSASYYVLGYYPENKNWDGKFRKIEVKVNRPDLEVRTRKGYFATDPTDWDKQKDKDKELEAVLSSELPQATLVTFDARVVPPPVSGRMKVPVQFLVDPRTLTYDEKKNGDRVYDVEFRVVAFTAEGKVAAHQEKRLTGPVKAKSVAQLEQSGFPYQTEIELSPGAYKLRLAVRDDRTGYFGTISLPLMLEKAASGK